MIHITAHAVQRFQERVANVPEDEARAALATPVIIRAAHFGCPYVKLGTGQRIVIKDFAIVTVLPSDHRPAAMDRRRYE